MHTADPTNDGVYQHQSEQKLCLILSFDREWAMDSAVKTWNNADWLVNTR